MVLPCMRSRLIRMRVSASCFQSSTPLAPQICSFDSLSMTHTFDPSGVLQRTDFSCFSQASTSGLSSGGTQTSGLLRGCSRSSGLAVPAESGVRTPHVSARPVRQGQARVVPKLLACSEAALEVPVWRWQQDSGVWTPHI